MMPFVVIIFVFASFSSMLGLSAGFVITVIVLAVFGVALVVVGGGFVVVVATAAAAALS